MAYSSYISGFYGFRRQVSAALRLVWRHKASKFYWPVIFLLQIGAWAQAFFISRNLSSNLLVLHYNTDFGIDEISDPGRIFWRPVGALVAWVLAIILAALVSRQKEFKLLYHLLFGTAAMAGLLTMLSLLAVYLINFR